jgi:hypothetical protein
MKKAKILKIKVKGTLSRVALEVLELSKDTLAAKHELPDRAWTVQEIREAVFRDKDS